MAEPNVLEPDYDVGTLRQTWRHFWHPVATTAELAARGRDGRGPLATTLLGERIGIAEFAGRIVAFADRCPHRGVALTLGWVEEQHLRCRYHGWCFDGGGTCVEIPSLSDQRHIHTRAGIEVYDCEVRYGLVWVRLESTIPTSIPRFDAWDDDSQRCIAGEPYLWKCSSGRRLENFMDVTHFPFAHYGTLGAPPNTVFAPFEVERRNGMMSWQTETFLAYNPGSDTYGPPADDQAVMLPPATYLIEMPFAITLKFTWTETFATQIFMHATPIDDVTCRSYWFTCHTVDDSDDDTHLALQAVILGEDQPVVESHQPAKIGDLADEVAVRPDKPMTTWRHWLRQIDRAARCGPDELGAALAAIEDVSDNQLDGPAAVLTP